jgi:hypothetical protein
MVQLARGAVEPLLDTLAEALDVFRKPGGTKFESDG